MINYLPPQYNSYLEHIRLLFPSNKSTKEITLQVTENCCMACTYCYQHHKTNKKMSFETAQIFIDKLLTDQYSIVNSDNTQAIIFDFIGGEPLLEIELIEKICEYTLRKMIFLNHPWLYHIRFSICSNGLLYTNPKVQSFFQKYNPFISFAISVDGNEELHDSCRVDTFGNKTYKTVINAAQLYQKQYGELPDTKMTLSPNNIHYTYSALLNLIKEGYKIIPFNCIFEQGWDYSHAKILYNELKKIADYLIYNNLFNKINIFMFKEMCFCPLTEQDNNNWCGGVNNQMLAIDSIGNMYSCIRYMESSLNGKQKPLELGNINTGYAYTEEQKNNVALITNITRRSQSTDECFYCPIAAGCSWCSGYNYEEFGTPNKRATYICCMHQAQALANVYYWNTLYKHLNIDKKFPMYILKEKALNIIDEKEYNYLLKLSQE